MKTFSLIAYLLLAIGLHAAEQTTAAEKNKLLEKHKSGSVKLGEDQDNLAADVLDMIEQQTATNVIEILNQVEVIMGETIDRLDTHDTSGDTIAAQTEIIEKIFEAAQKRQEEKDKEREEQEKKDQQNGEGDKPKEGGEDKEGQGKGQGEGKGKGKGKSSPGGGMMEMLRRMMEDGGDAPGKKAGEEKGDKPGQKGGNGQTGDSDSLNKNFDGPVKGKKESRTVPRSTGTTPEALPREFHKALDAYNRALRTHSPTAAP